jgi:hypothetical protein
MASIKTLTTTMRLSLGILAVGLMLLTFMITVEGEPGALPLLLVLAGSAGFGISRYRLARQSR